ncbi:MAG TPA: type II toxin-antitoxin system HicA family toxin [Streptosporangiaceae bacterium]|nr:type II toxin-antitoxin system HicA family toxin [Streptosporangiaceae bacterium]
MAKAARVLAALKRDGWTETRRSASHRVLVKSDQQEGLVTSVLRVELFFDEEAGNWHYRVPALHINGGGTPTRQDAERDDLSAIAFALEGDPRDYDTDAETLTLDVNMAPAA